MYVIDAVKQCVNVNKDWYVGMVLAFDPREGSFIKAGTSRRHILDILGDDGPGRGILFVDPFWRNVLSWESV